MLSGLGEGCRDGGPGECWGEGGNAEFSLEQVESGVPGLSQKFSYSQKGGDRWEDDAGQKVNFLEAGDWPIDHEEVTPCLPLAPGQAHSTSQVRRTHLGIRELDLPSPPPYS